MKILEDVPLERATIGQIEKAFKERGHVSGQMADKSIRFCLHAHKEAGIKYSDLLSMRKNGSASGKPRTPKPKVEKAKKPEDVKGETKGKDAEEPPNGTIRYPIYFKNKSAGWIQVPEGLNPEDLKVFSLTVDLVKAYAGGK